MTIKRYGSAVVLLGALLLSTGCKSTLFKQGYYALRGAKGSFYELKDVNPAALAEYESVRVGAFTNDLGLHVPGEVVSEVNRNVPLVLKKELFFDEGKRLRVQGRIVHFIGNSGSRGALKAIISGDDVCVCRVELRDDETDALIGEAMCWGEVKSAIRRGADEFGEGVGKGVARWIKDRLPREIYEQRREALREERRGERAKDERDEPVAPDEDD